MDKWEELRYKEQALQEQEDKLIKERQQVENVDIFYSDYHQKENRFFDELEEFYSDKSDIMHFMSSRMTEIAHKTAQIFVELGDCDETLRQNKRRVADDIDNMYYERRKLLSEEEETKKV